MKQKWKRRGKGAISIFLIIIFLAQYILCGVLVDSARHRMASAMAESALDSASTSVLSYYNQLVYDLYGLMAVDGMNETAIQEKLTSYVERTLGIAELDSQSALNLLEELMKAAFGNDTAKPKGFDGYDFQATVTAKVTTSLADTDFVEYQLIEHMKYRAPVLLLDSSTGFFAKLNGLSEIKDRLVMAQEKIKLSKEQQSNAKNASNTLKGIDEFIKSVRAYVSDPANWTESSQKSEPVTPKPLADYVAPIDEAAKGAAEDYLDEWEDYRSDYAAYEAACENAGPDDPTPTPPTAPSWTRDDWAAKLKPGVEKAQKNFAFSRENAKKLQTKAQALISAIDSEVASYASHIAKLKSKMDSHGGDSNQNAVTVFSPEMELAEANAGQLLKNRPFLSYVAEFAGEIGDANNAVTLNENIAKIMGTSASGAIPGNMASDLKSRMTAVEGATSTSTNGHLPNPICATAAELLKHPSVDFSWLENNLTNLNNALDQDAIPNVHKAEIDVTVSGEKSKEEVDKKLKEDTKKAELRPLNEEDLKIKEPSKDKTLKEEFDISNKVNKDNSADSADKMLGAAGGVLDKLMSLLEDLRDDVYVNQYAAYYFPNYVENYKATDKVKDGDNAKKFIDGSYKDYCATQAELEYVLTGEADTGKSVLEVQAMLLGIRTAFNLIAIFTDSAKVSQANAIAAMAGPFAPAVAIALLVAWAVAESTLDVIDLCKGEEVPLFKQGADWKLSVEGAAKNAVEEAITAAVDYGTTQLKDKVTSMTDQVANAANKAIYAAYQGANSSLNAGVAAAKNKVAQWNSDLGADLNGVAGGEAVQTAMNQAVSEFNSTLDTAVAPIGNGLSSVKDKAVQQVNKAADTIKNKAEEKLTALGEQFTDAAAEKVGGFLKDKLPIGSPKSTEGATSLIGMTYMDYIQIFLLLQNQKTKVKHIQSLVQANLRYYGKNNKNKLETFSMAENYGAVEATLDGSIKFLFMSEPVIPVQFRQNGRLKISAHSAVSY